MKKFNLKKTLETVHKYLSNNFIEKNEKNPKPFYNCFKSYEKKLIEGLSKNLDRNDIKIIRLKETNKQTND